MELAAPAQTPEPVPRVQQHLPLAFVQGNTLTVLPIGLYIPPPTPNPRTALSTPRVIPHPPLCRVP